MNDEALTCSQAATILGVRVGTIYALVSQKRIPHRRFGPRFVRFSKLELGDWLRSKAVSPVEPSENR